MAEKNFNTRIIHKHDTEANWLKAENFIPKKGELIVYDKDVNYSYSRFKIGDGETFVNNLPFSMEQSDWNQTDETQNDYIKNKPDIDGLQSTIDSVSYLVGDKKVSEQIDAAIDGLADIAATGSFNDLIDKPEAISIEEINQICDTYVAARGGEF